MLQEERTKVSVAQHADHFKKEAAAHNKASWSWLIASAVFAAATLGVAVWWWGNVAGWWGTTPQMSGITIGEALAGER